MTFEELDECKLIDFTTIDVLKRRIEYLFELDKFVGDIDKDYYIVNDDDYKNLVWFEDLLVEDILSILRKFRSVYKNQSTHFSSM